MAKVKICGLTNLRDALQAVAYGVDALGFNFYPPSPRFISTAAAAAIIRELPPDVCKVGVFVNEPKPSIESVIRECKTGDLGLTALQFHGDEEPAYCRNWSLKVIKALRVKGPETLRAVDDFPADLFLLDSWSSGFGGSGTSFRWEWLTGFNSSRMVLAGGLDLENIRQAVRDLKPFAVDVCSGVESAPGIKDYAKMRDFVAAVKNS
jgi:phosphoribosylanthranilate isomerase